MLATRTPEGTQNLVVVQGRAVDGDGSLWIRIDGPGLPGEADGWVPRAGARPLPRRLTRGSSSTSRSYTATLFRRDRVLARFPVGVGTARRRHPGASSMSGAG